MATQTGQAPGGQGPSSPQGVGAREGGGSPCPPSPPPSQAQTPHEAHAMAGPAEQC